MAKYNELKGDPEHLMQFYVNHYLSTPEAQPILDGVFKGLDHIKEQVQKNHIDAHKEIMDKHFPVSSNPPVDPTSDIPSPTPTAGIRG